MNSSNTFFFDLGVLSLSVSGEELLCKRVVLRHVLLSSALAN